LLATSDGTCFFANLGTSGHFRVTSLRLHILLTSKLSHIVGVTIDADIPVHYVVHDRWFLALKVKVNLVEN